MVLLVSPVVGGTNSSTGRSVRLSSTRADDTLNWGDRPSDLDSYLITPSGAQVYYISRGSLTGAPFANLDVDDTTAYGPEVVTIARLMVGTYKYAVNNYSGQSSAQFSVSSARVELSLTDRPVELFVPPTTGETSSTNWWHLFELDVD
ncbi:MAG: YfaP family protein, partial [Rubrivivax sp.]